MIKLRRPNFIYIIRNHLAVNGFLLISYPIICNINNYFIMQQVEQNILVSKS